MSSAGIRPFAPIQVDSRAGPRPGPRLHGAHRDSHNAVGRAPAEDPSSCVTGESHGHRELDGHGPPARTPAFRERAVGGTGGSLPVELQLPFGAPIPSTADSGGRQRKRRERESPQWALAAGRCRRGSSSDTPQPGPTRSARAPGDKVLGSSATQWHAEAEAGSVPWTRAGLPGASLVPTRGQGCGDKR